MRFLLREQTGAFDLSTAVTIEQIKAAGAEGTLEQYLIAPDATLSHLARYDVPERYAKLCMTACACARTNGPAMCPAAAIRACMCRAGLWESRRPRRMARSFPAWYLTTIRKDVRKHERTDKNP